MRTARKSKAAFVRPDPNLHDRDISLKAKVDYVQTINDQQELGEIATDYRLNPEERQEAIEKLTDQKYLIEASKNERDKYILREIAWKLEDRKALINMAIRRPSADLCVKVVSKYTDKEDVLSVYNSIEDTKIRSAMIGAIHRDETLMEILKKR